MVSQASLDSGGICRACALCCNVFLYLYSPVPGSIDLNRIEILKLFFGIHGFWCVVGIFESEVAPIRYALFFVLSDSRLEFHRVHLQSSSPTGMSRSAL